MLKEESAILQIRVNLGVNISDGMSVEIMLIP
jgi:hypothetical protein